MVIAVAFTTYAFDGNVENSRDGIKLGLYHVQVVWIAKKMAVKNAVTRMAECDMTATLFE